ncbi:hypothetical protein LTR36_001093 [Oleoguttula mirabilis]|uniref:Dipeptidyl-peptidase V n=1 Tax=Oleoguttula mirabilis TaxID=1507867 RepID=A0AAV9JPC2_9PEZI|nr:hypothetical protein LTR36_001093 [Oleoguttula mirabilis]
MQQDKKAFVERLCDLQIPADLSFSPNGQRILYSTALTWGHRKDLDGCAVSSIWVAETGKPNSARRLTTGLSKDYNPRWSPDGESIAFLSDGPTPTEHWGIFVLHLRESGEDDSKAHLVTPSECQREITAFEWAPDGKSIAYISTDETTAECRAKGEGGEDVHVWGEDWKYARLRTVDLETKRTVCLTESGKKQDEKHVVDLCFIGDGKQLAFAWTRTPHIEEALLTGTAISVVAIEGMCVRDLCTFPSELYDLTSAENGKLCFRAGVPAGKFNAGQAVYAVDPTLLSPTYLITAFGVEDDVVGLAKTNRGDIVVRLERNLSSSVALLDGRALCSQDQDVSASAAIYSTDIDDILIALVKSDVNHPSELYSTTAGDDGLVQLTNHGGTLKDQVFGTCTFLSCRSTDGEVELDRVFFTPASNSTDKQRKPLPSIVLIHGGPARRDTNGFDVPNYMWAPALLSLNPNVGILLPNYRGSRGKGETFAEYSSTSLGDSDYADVIALVQAAIVQGFIDKDNIMVGGWSQGGYLSYLCSVRNGTHGFGWSFKAAISGAGPCDWDTMILTSDLGASAELELNGGRAPWNMDTGDVRNRSASALWEFSAAVKRAVETGKMTIPPMHDPSR